MKRPDAEMACQDNDDDDTAGGSAVAWYLWWLIFAACLAGAVWLGFTFFEQAG